jgi:preprotein translocase subunit SecY
MPDSWFNRLTHKRVRLKGLVSGGMLSLALIRLAVPMPNAQVMTEYFRRNDFGPLLRWYDRLVGGAVSRGSILALGIMPYLSARTFRFLAAKVVPSVATLETTVAGRRRLARWTARLTDVLSLVQAYGYTRFTLSIPGAVAEPGLRYTLQTVGVLTVVAIVMGRMCMYATEPDLIADPEPELATPVEPPALNEGMPDDGGAVRRVVTPLPSRGDHASS